MISKFVKGKVGVFIDAANIFYSQRTLGWRIDYEKLLGYIRRECSISIIRYYTGKVGALEKQLSFIKKLERLGYVVTAKEVKLIKAGNGGFVPKSNLDVELALDAFMSQESYETLLLFSGDSDFAYLLELLKQRGKRVIVVSTRGHISKELLDRAKYIDLKKLRQQLELEKNQKPLESGL